MLSLCAAVALLAVAEEAPPDKTSLPTEAPEEAWRHPGVRVGLGYALEGVAGVEAAPGGVAHSALLRIGARLDPDWSLFLSLRYGVLPGAYPGLRYSGVVEPALHLFDHLTLSAGAGVAGFVYASTGRPTPEPQGGIVATLSVPASGPRLGACAGVGVIAVARAEYAWVVSELFSTGPALQVDLQWTACRQSLGRSDPDTAEPIELEQRWRHFSASLGWLVWWR